MNKAGWTEVPDLIALLRRRWDSGRYLRDHARGEAWEPISLPVKGPAAGVVLDRFDEVRQWAAAFASKAIGRFDIDERTVSGRTMGTNRIPARVRITTFDQLCSLLGTGGDVYALDELLKETGRRVPALVCWAADHPLVLLDHRESWERLLATVGWIAANSSRRMYLRQIDVEGVDTKFIERHQRLLTELLLVVLSAGEITESPSADFARRFGFLPKPNYTRLRFLDATSSPFPTGVTEVTVRTGELARMELDVATVFVVENEVTYLAFPDIPRAAVIFGSGFASKGLAELPWMTDVQIVYWGDIDTHGFDILSRLRSLLPEVRTILMDQETLLFHRLQWATEPSPTRRPLSHLTDAEQSLYQDLIADRYGVGVRLEQERVLYPRVCDALQPWADLPSTKD